MKQSKGNSQTPALGLALKETNPQNAADFSALTLGPFRTIASLVGLGILCLPFFVYALAKKVGKRSVEQ